MSRRSRSMAERPPRPPSQEQKILQHILVVLLLLYAVILAFGCDDQPPASATSPPPTFNGVFRVANDSNRAVEVPVLDGLVGRMPMGTLQPGVFSQMSFHPRPFPNSITITWRYLGESDQTTTLSLAGITPPTDYRLLLIRFTPQQQWEVSNASW